MTDWKTFLKRLNYDAAYDEKPGARGSQRKPGASLGLKKDQSSGGCLKFNKPDDHYREVDTSYERKSIS